MAQCQPDISYVVLWLLMSDGKSRPGQPSVRKHSRHLAAAWDGAKSGCSDLCKGPTWDQLNQKPDVSRVCAVTFVLLQKCVLWVPRVQSKLNSKSSVQCTSLPRILAFSFYVVPFFSQTTNTSFLRSHIQ